MNKKLQKEVTDFLPNLLQDIIFGKKNNRKMLADDDKYIYEITLTVEKHIKPD